jgi:hypothetical protein
MYPNTYDVPQPGYYSNLALLCPMKVESIVTVFYELQTTIFF